MIERGGVGLLLNTKNSSGILRLGLGLGLLCTS